MAFKYGIFPYLIQLISLGILTVVYRAKIEKPLEDLVLPGENRSFDRPGPVTLPGSQSGGIIIVIGAFIVFPIWYIYKSPTFVFELGAKLDLADKSAFIKALFLKTFGWLLLTYPSIVFLASFYGAATIDFTK